MIPKVIHYCWFGRGEKPKLVKKCIRSWKKHCPDYQIIEWNEDNYDISTAPLFVRQAIEARKWAFATDYIRLKVVYDYGGIYLDTDVQLINGLDKLLNNQAYFGFMACGNKLRVASGLGFGAEKGTKILAELMRIYETESFILPEGGYNTRTNSSKETEVLHCHGLIDNGAEQMLDGEIHIFPPEYFCPLDQTVYNMKKTRNTVSIHWGNVSWVTEGQKREIIRIRAKNKIDHYLHLPNRLAIRLLGIEKYTRIKQLLKH